MNKTAPASARAGPLAEAVLRKIRIPFIQRAHLAHDGRRWDVFLVDLGLSGVFAELSAPLPAGDSVDVSFHLPGNEIPIAARCRVAWWRPSGVLPRSLPAGAGLEFVELAPEHRARIRDHIVEHCRSAPRARRFARPWTQDDDPESP
ncbi:MAG: PilZ domain-containing protein [Vicinamibacteria bacterium]